MRSTGLVGFIFFVSIAFSDADTLVTNSNVLRPNTVSWTKSQAESETGVSNIRFLRTRSIAENEERAGLSVPIVEKVKTVLSSSKVPVTPEQLQKWLNNDKSADAVFTRLHLHQAGKRLFSNPQFATWLQYADDLSAKHPTKDIPAIGTLSRQYDDKTLYKMIKVAKMAPTTKELATKLQAEQLQHWVSTRKSADDVFRLFKLDKAGRTIFSNPEFVTWTKYVDDLNAKHPEEPTSMVPTLTKYFNDDDTVFKMIETAKGVEETKNIATKVETEWLVSWLQSRKTPFNALNDLKLANSANTLLESPRFSTWVKYLD
ncbi:Avirulence (Avh) protein, partial [Phytophthora megakarya]